MTIEERNAEAAAERAVSDKMRREELAREALYVVSLNNPLAKYFWEGRKKITMQPRVRRLQQ